MTKSKKEEMDLKPIFIYLGSMFFLPVLLMIVFAFRQVNEDISNTIIQFFALLVPAIIFIKMYYKRIVTDAKSIPLRTLLIILIMGVVGCILNEVITPYITTENQEILVQMIKTLPVLSCISICLLGPFVEEMVFRYSFDTFIKNDKVFILVSSLVFGLIHTSGFGTGWWLYVLIGLLLSYVYIKANHNVVASTMIHILLNIVDFLFIIL